MMLNNLKPPPGSKKKSKRVGRGPGSGRGRTCGRGNKGQLSRSGSKKSPGFEGGQMPLLRRLPKRGFNKFNRKEYESVKLQDLNIFEEGSVITPETLKQSNIIRSNKPVKILADGNLQKRLTIKAHNFSKQALSKIHSCEGIAEVLKI
ncbi:MAG: 50S ribosomal protein L15 [Candidatus Hydrogenedentota bacterium]